MGLTDRTPMEKARAVTQALGKKESSLQRRMICRQSLGSKTCKSRRQWHLVETQLCTPVGLKPFSMPLLILRADFEQRLARAHEESLSLARWTLEQPAGLGYLQGRVCLGPELRQISADCCGLDLTTTFSLASWAKLALTPPLQLQGHRGGVTCLTLSA